MQHIVSYKLIDCTSLRMFLAIFKKHFHASAWIIMRTTPESNRSVQDCRSYKIFERKFQQVQRQNYYATNYFFSNPENYQKKKCLPAAPLNINSIILFLPDNFQTISEKPSTTTFPSY